MKPMYKAALVLFFLLVLVGSILPQAFAAINDSLFNPLWKKNNDKYLEILNGQPATLMTGYFGTNLGQVKVTATLNKINKNDVKIVSYLAKDKVVKMSNGLGYQEFTITPAHYKDTAGDYVVVIKLKDSNSERADASLYLKVKPSNAITQEPSTIVQEPPPMASFFNTAPKMKSISDQHVFEDELVQFTVSATDKENDKLEYSGQVYSCLGNICLWLPLWESSFNQDSGVFAWTPSYDSVKHPSLSKNIDFRFRADDGDEVSAWEAATIAVKDVNRNPVFDNIPNKVVPEEQLLQFTVSAADADDDKLKYSILAASPPLQGASLDQDTGLFKWVPTDAQAGLYSVTFKVADNFGGKDLENVLITVTDVVKPQCDDNLDNDGDSKKDENDPGCHTDGNTNNPGSYDANDNDETDPVDLPECNDGKDNDNDSAVDLHDPGCHTDGNPNNPGSYDANDNDETDPVDLPECKDGKDNDGDRKTDFPNDPGCSNKDDDNEKDEPQCNDGIDNDLDTYTDYPNDPGCTSEDDDNETDEPQCNDGKDNDNDSAVDLHDLGCENPEDNDESNTDETPTPQPKPTSYTNIKFKSAHVEESIAYPGKIMAVNVNIFNNGKTNLKDVEVQAVIYDIGAFGSTSDFNLSKGKGASKSIYVHIPEEAQPGWYLVKITAKNSNYHTSTYRLAYIDNNTSQ